MWLPLGRLWGEGLERAWVQGEADPPPQGLGQWHLSAHPGVVSALTGRVVPGRSPCSRPGLRRASPLPILPGTSSMPCAGKSRNWWRRSWTSTACWSPGPCPGPSEPSSTPLGWAGELPYLAPTPPSEPRPRPGPGPSEGLPGLCRPCHGPRVPPSSMALPPLVPSCPQEGQLAGRQGEEADAAPAGGGPPWGAAPGGRWGWQHREPGGPPRDGAPRGQGGGWDRWVWGPGDQDGPCPVSPPRLSPGLVSASALCLPVWLAHMPSPHLSDGSGVLCPKSLLCPCWLAPPSCLRCHPPSPIHPQWCLGPRSSRGL